MPSPKSYWFYLCLSCAGCADISTPIRANKIAIVAKQSSSKPKRLSLVGAAVFLLGAMLVGYAVYGETIDSMLASQEQTDLAKTTQRDFSSEPDNAATKPAEAEVFAVLYAPKLGEDFRRPVAEGTSVEDVLNTVGIGHYLNTAFPGEPGNVALASHRTTHGGAFNYIDRLIPGDRIYLETRLGWYTYEVYESATVKASDLWVISRKPTDLAGDKILTLTTCTPRYTSEKRLVVWANQVDYRTRLMGPPDEIKDLAESE